MKDLITLKVNKLNKTKVHGKELFDIRVRFYSIKPILSNIKSLKEESKDFRITGTIGLPIVFRSRTGPTLEVFYDVDIQDLLDDNIIDKLNGDEILTIFKDNKNLEVL